jgi:hypothetical protein
MSDRSLPPTQAADDLDTGQLLINTITFLRRYGWKLALSSLAGLLVGGFIYYLLPHTYKAKMVVESSVVSNAQDLRIINNWDGLLNRGGYPELSRLFNQPLDAVSTLNEIKAELIPGIDETSGIVIEVTVSDSAALPAIQQGIVYALGNSEYIRQRVQTRRENLQSQIQQTRLELNRLDSVKPYIGSFSSVNQPANTRLVLDVSNISGQRLNCEDRIALFEERLKFLKGVYLLQDFVRSKRAKIVPAPTLPLMGLIIGFLLSYFVSISSVLRKKYFAVEKPGVAS